MTAHARSSRAGALLAALVALSAAPARAELSESDLADKKVLIVGAGPTGLISAIEQVMHGERARDVLVVDMRPERTRVQVLALTQASIDHLEGRLGLQLTEGKDVTYLKRRLVVQDGNPSGNEDRELPRALPDASRVTDVIDPANEGPPVAVIRINDLERILLAKAKSMGIRLGIGEKALKLEPRGGAGPGGRVRVTLDASVRGADGSLGRRTVELNAKYALVAAGSAGRELLSPLGVQWEPRDQRQTRLAVAILKKPGDRAFRARRVADPAGGNRGLVALGHEQGTGLLVELPTDLERSLPTDKEARKAVLKDWVAAQAREHFGMAAGEVEYDLAPAEFPVALGRASHMVTGDGRVFALGDSAMQTHVFTAAGASTGMRQALSCCRVIRDLEAGAEPGPALAAYERKTFEGAERLHTVARKAFQRGPGPAAPPAPPARVAGGPPPHRSVADAARLRLRLGRTGLRARLAGAARAAFRPLRAASRR